MRCPRCRHDNPPPSRFCLECSAKLAVRCANCGTEVPGGADFGDECGQPAGAVSTGSAPSFGSPRSYAPAHLAEKILISRSALEGERKQVAVLFADLRGFMELLADRDPEEARKILDPVLEHMIEAVHRYEGTVNQVMGDGIMALFGAPLAQEDHALRATYAARRMQEAIRRYAAELQRSAGVPVQIRVGLNSGQVVVRSIGSDLRMDYTAVGQTTHLAARMEQTAMPGSILVTASLATPCAPRSGTVPSSIFTRRRGAPMAGRRCPRPSNAPSRGTTPGRQSGSRAGARTGPRRGRACQRGLRLAPAR